MADILYLKIDRNVQAKGSPVHLRDIAGLYCSAKQIENKVRTLRLPTEVIRGPGRYVFSVLDVIAVIQQEYPSLEIENLGETDFIITVEKKQTMPDAANWGKTVFVCVLAFFGAAFSIMAFNNDVSVPKLFDQIYQWVTGIKPDGITIMEISYSIGISIGILVFFNHFGKKRFSVDPTPMEVQMRLYENDIQTTLVEDASRKEEELDVGRANHPGGHRA